MATATIIETKHDDTWAWMWVRVSGDRTINGQAVDVEYQGKVPVAQLQGLTGAQIRAVLVAAVQAERARSQALSQPQQTDLGLSGQVLI